MLTLGRELNAFKDWSHTDDKNEEILQRAKEIQDLVEVNQRAMSKIDDAQDVQRQRQDNVQEHKL